MAAAVPNEARWMFVEIEDVAMPDSSVFTGDRLIRSLPVDDAFFDVYDLPLLTGRGFEAGDFAAGRTAVIVNRAFVETVLGHGNPLGRRVRYIRTENSVAPQASGDYWYEIVGVVANQFSDTRRGTMFHPTAAGDRDPGSAVGATAPSARGHLQTGARPARGRDGRRRPGRASARPLHTGRTGGRLGHPRHRARRGDVHDGGRSARNCRTGPTRPPGRSDRGATRGLACSPVAHVALRTGNPREQT